MLKFTKHPFIKMPDPELLLFLSDPRHPERHEKLVKLWEDRETAIKLTEEDPYNFGIELEQWNDAWELFEKYPKLDVLGANRSTKSNFGAKTIVKAAVMNPNSLIWCFSQDSASSLAVQQKMVRHYLPNEFKKNIKTSVEYIKFSEKTGFTGNPPSFILPNGSQVEFQTYSSFLNNETKFEGYKLGSPNPSFINVGVWFDEYLLDDKLYNRVMARLSDYGAKALMTVTPIKGLSPFIQSKIGGSRTLKEVDIPREAFPEAHAPAKVPYIQINDEAENAVIYFQMKNNPWSGFENMVKLKRGSSMAERLTVFCGIPYQTSTSIFPLFSHGLNVLSDKPNGYGMTFPDVTTKDFTHYQVVDPAGNRNYVSIWAAVNKSGDVYIWNEWPNADTYGEWAEYGSGGDGGGRWRYGPGSKKVGFNCQMYANAFREVEGGVKVLSRIIDSRFASTEGSNNNTLFQDFASCNPPMYFEPSSGKGQNEGLERLDDWFSYNTDIDIDSANRPRLFIHERCKNLINAVANYSMSGKADEALKDWIDLLRYLRMANGGEGPIHIDDNSFQPYVPELGSY